ncbi:MAG: phage tail tape measure protein [Gordonia sp. (in: high G+C Gram-positive bacteria)]
MPGGRIEIDVALNNDDVIDKLDEMMAAAGETAAGVGETLLGAFAAGGITAGLQQVVDLGSSFDAVLNQIAGVSGATAAQMEQVSDKARQLGNDITLPATSAPSAAAAMLELAKGGLSVEESMTAARGSLALAAAAQIDAGQAAEIQAQALSTFSLKASDAEHVADVLANTANKSSAGITDLADGMQQVGSVAAQFHMTVDQTAAALGVLANNGIEGSDAGTLLKSTLLALQDTGEPAAAAMKTLGIRVYDAQGKFRGLGSVMDDLHKASATLTEEQFNQASATLFGSDAMRLAGIAAKDGAASFNEMTAAVGKQGGAADLAAKMNAGLPGAMEKLQNSAESAQLALYELLRGPVTALANFGAGGLTKLSDWIGGDDVAGKLGEIGGALRPIGEDLREIGEDAVSGGGSLRVLGETAQQGGDAAIAAFKPLAGLAAGLVAGFSALPVPAQTAALAMAAFAVARNRMTTALNARAEAGTAGRIQRLGMAVRQFGGEMRTQNALYTQSMAAQNRYGQSLTRTQQAMAAYRTSTIPAVAATRDFAGHVTTMRAAAAAAGQPISRLAGTFAAMGERSGTLGRIAQSFTTASQGATRFGTAAGLASAGVTAARVGASGLMGALGGPFGIALTGAALGLSMYSQRQQEAKQAAEEHKAVVDGLAESINAETGALSAAGTEQMQKALADRQFARGGADGGGRNPYDIIDSNQQLAVSAQAYTQAAAGQAQAMDDVNQRLDSQIRSALESSDTWKDWSGALAGAGISADDMVQALRGNQEMIDRIEDATESTTTGLRGRSVDFRDFSQSLSQAGQDAAELGTNLTNANGSMSEAQRQALQNAAALAKADPAARSLASAMEVLGDRTASAADRSNALKQALDVLSGGAEGVDAARGQGLAEVERLPQLWQAAADAAGGYSGIIDQSTGRIAVNSEATRALSGSIAQVKSSMNSAASAAYEYALSAGQGQTAARQAAVAASQDIYDSFLRTADGARAAGVDVDALMRSMNLLPPERLVRVLAPGATAVQAEIVNISDRLAEVPNNKSIYVESISDEARQKLLDVGATVRDLPDGRVEVLAETDAARARIDDLTQDRDMTVHVHTIEEQTTYVNNVIAAYQAQGNTVHPGGGNAGGGPIGYAVGGGIGVDGAIRGPGTATSDSIRTVAPVGGHVVTAAEVAAAGGHAAVNDRLEAMSQPGRGPRTAGVGGLRPVALSNGEHFVSPEQVDAVGGHDSVFALRRALRGGGQQLALGGLVRSEQVGHANDGLPYISGARDCSMWVSWMVAAAKGEPLQRLFTTYTLIGGQTAGLVSGASPNDLLTVGTSQEHMAATVMTAAGPVNTESGGNSSPSQVRWGRGAAGAFDGQFPYKFHLPVELINPKPTIETAAPANSASPYIPDAEANRRDQAAIRGENDDDAQTQRQYIEPPTPPKLEDVAAEAAKIGVRGLLETFGLQDSILASPERSTIGQAAQIIANTNRFRDEQSTAPERSTGTGAGTTGEDDTSAGSGVGTPQTHQTTQPEVDDPYALVNSAEYDPAAGAAQWGKEIAAALRISGMAQSWSDAMVGQGDIESKGDPKAEGPDSSDGKPQGWMQVKPPTFAAHRDPKLPDDPFNVLANGVASLNYVKARYGDPGGANWPTTAGYAAGGLHPMRGDQASIVAPNTWRVVGDRPVADEFFIPDTDDPQHVAIGAEWARRRGYQLVQMHADGGIAARAAGGQSALLDGPRGEVHHHTHTHEGSNYTYSGPAKDVDAFFGGARRHDRIDRQGVGITRIGRKGSVRR